jgi:hypothetical protein
VEVSTAAASVAGQYGKAAFDTVGPLLLIGWAEVGSGLLQAIGEVNPPGTAANSDGFGVEQQGGQSRSW